MTIDLKKLSYLFLGVAGTSGIIWGLDAFINKEDNLKPDKTTTSKENTQLNEGWSSKKQPSNDNVNIFNSEGYDKDGFNNHGFDKEGYDKNGYNIYGRDRDGYNRHGFDKEGFNRAGIDSEGYSKTKFNVYGVDRAGYCYSYYEERIPIIRARLNEAKQKLQDGEFRYALFDSRVVMDEALRLLVHHYDGVNESDDSMLTNLKICESKNLIHDKELIDHLHAARIICNKNNHNISNDETLTHQKVYFVIMQINDLLDKVEYSILYKSKTNNIDIFLNGRKKG